MLQPGHFEKMSVVIDCDSKGMHGVTTRLFVKTGKALLAYFPERLHKIFVYNYSTVLEKEWVVLAQAIPAKTVDKIVWVQKSSLSVIAKNLGTKGLPQKYGGDLPPINGSYWPPRPVNNGDADDNQKVEGSFYTINGEQFDKKH